MLIFLARRALIALLVTLTVLTISFALTRLSGDLAVAIAGPQANATDVEIIRKAYGLDRPMIVQFFAWVTSAAQGDLGRSYFYHDSVSNLIMARLPVTLTLGVAGLSIAILTAIPLGILAAMREGSLLDRGIMTIAVIGQAMPSFWLGLTLIIVFGLKLSWLPISGVETWHGYILPAVVLSFSAIPARSCTDTCHAAHALATDICSHRCTTFPAASLSRFSFTSFRIHASIIRFISSLQVRTWKGRERNVGSTEEKGGRVDGGKGKGGRKGRERSGEGSEKGRSKRIKIVVAKISEYPGRGKCISGGTITGRNSGILDV